MIEVLAFPLLLIAAAAFPKRKGNDKKKIIEHFTNIGYGLKKDGKLETPRLLSHSPILDGETEVGTSYLFKHMPGLRTDLNPESLADSIGKPVDCEFKRGEGLRVNVYMEDIRETIPFSEIPEPPKDKNNKVIRWAVPVGRGYKGWVWHKFDEIPHMCIAGTTRFGKTVLLRLIMWYLIMFQPNDVEFYIIDLKGKLEFNRYRNLKQVKAIAGTPEEAYNVLKYLTNEQPKEGEDYGVLEYEMAHFEKNLISNITETDIKLRRFIIVDEGAQLTPAKYLKDNDYRVEARSKLARITSVFGALGVRLIFATQYPTANTLDPSIKMNSDAKVSFRLPTGYASDVAIDEYGAEKLPSHIKGRALMKTHELKEMQVPYITHDDAWNDLQRYQDPEKAEGEKENVVTYSEEVEPSGSDSSEPRNHEVRDKRTDSKNSRVRFL